MAFNIYDSVILYQQRHAATGILGRSVFVKRMFGTNYVWKINALILTIFVFSRFILYGTTEFYRNRITNPFEIIFNAWSLLIYSYVIIKYTWLVKNRKDPSVGLKTGGREVYLNGTSIKSANREVYLNLRYIPHFGIMTNVALLIFPFLVTASLFKMFVNEEWFFVIHVINSVVLIWLLLPSFLYLYIENNEVTYYSKAKNSVRSLLKREQKELVPLPVST